MPEKMYVNLQRNVADAATRHHGVSLDLVARCEGVINRIRGARAVTWDLTTNYDGFDPGRIEPARAPKLRFPRTLPQQDDTLAFENGLQLAPVSGVSYTVTARREAAEGTDSIGFRKEYQAWRALFVDVVYMDAGCKAFYDAVKARFIAALADASIEVREVNVVQAAVVEAQTNPRHAVNGMFLKNLYNPPKALAHAPHHVRVVICKDIVDLQPREVSWNMTNQTLAGTGITRVWSTGDVVHYESPIQVMTDIPAAGATVSVIGATAVPANRIARIDAHTLEIALNNADLQAVEADLQAARKVSLKATLVGERAKVLTLKATMAGAGYRLAPVVIGTTEFRLVAVGEREYLHVRDPEKRWTAAPVVSAVLTRRRKPAAADGQWRDDDGQGQPHRWDVTARMQRVDDNELRVEVTQLERIVRILQGGDERKIREGLGVHAHDVRYKLTLQVELTLHHDAGQVQSQREVKVLNGTDVSYNPATHVVRIHDRTLRFAMVDPLVNAELFSSAAPVVIPQAQMTNPWQFTRRINIDLSNCAALTPVQQAFAAGRRLEFKVTLNMRESMGGYSPDTSGDFIALTTVRLKPDEQPATTQDRLLFCLLHELGHAHDLAVAGQTYHRGVEPATRSNARYYRDPFGGEGPHCSHNAALKPSGPSYGEKSTSSGQVYKRDVGAGTLCVMYHDLDLVNGAPRFCPSCRDDLRAAARLALDHDPQSW